LKPSSDHVLATLLPSVVVVSSSTIAMRRMETFSVKLHPKDRVLAMPNSRERSLGAPVPPPMVTMSLVICLPLISTHLPPLLALPSTPTVVTLI
jgi:hypothetical protein